MLLLPKTFDMSATMPVGFEEARDSSNVNAGAGDDGGAAGVAAKKGFDSDGG